jgi:hypothetical protein
VIVMDTVLERSIGMGRRLNVNPLCKTTYFIFLKLVKLKKILIYYLFFKKRTRRVLCYKKYFIRIKFEKRIAN